ncbi:MAG: hypothetical protein ABIY55_16390, partial [Kofleriaceae bacterium]
MMATALWFAGLLGLLIATLVASARARAAPADVVRRGVIASAALAYVAIVVAAVWTWGGATATTGRATQLREGALVHLTVESVRVPLTGAIAIGHGGDAAVRVPGEGGELARIERAANGDAIVHGTRLAAVHGDDGAASATARGCVTSDATYTLPAGAAVAVIECDGDRPARAFVVRDVQPGELAITPLAWRGRFVAEQLTARAGDALRIGGADEAIAGLTTWDVVAPHGASAMLAIPADPTDCGAWLPDAGATVADVSSSAASSPAGAAATASGTSPDGRSPGGATAATGGASPEGATAGTSGPSSAGAPASTGGASPGGASAAK